MWDEECLHSRAPATRGSRCNRASTFQVLRVDMACSLRARIPGVGPVNRSRPTGQERMKVMALERGAARVVGISDARSRSPRRRAPAALGEAMPAFGCGHITSMVGSTPTLRVDPMSSKPSGPPMSAGWARRESNEPNRPTSPSLRFRRSCGFEWSGGRRGAPVRVGAEWDRGPVSTSWPCQPCNSAVKISEQSPSLGSANQYLREVNRNVLRIRCQVMLPRHR